MTVPVDPSAGRAGHLDLDALADLDAGLLPDDAAAAARSHLESCAECAVQARALRGVPTLLAAAAEAGPMPADVADRLHAALAEARPPAGEADEGAPEPPAATAAATTVTPMPTRTVARERSPWSMRVLQAAAVVVLLLGGTGVVLSAIQDTGGEAGSTATETSAGGGDAAPEAAASNGYPVTASGRNWSPETVVEAVPEIVAGTVGPPAESPAADQGGPDGTPDTEDSARALSSAGRLASGEELARCVGNLNLGPVTPLAVDLARWEGNPAAVIVLPTPDDPSTADLFVVTPACPAGEFLYFARVPRP